ncbi:PREDICTED: macrophage mannose receptor 1-like [Branchiostoma belcheri]|uniref:Macrophage mannose receptor 1-like n=1 Tax=Branchiostoma belcheri TaxID=7741 RepID=A0A6P4Z3G8_BRABE|nr:PREDICTED: macrophage mannose receptor 1-like [Branchiostoma belcheri]
MSFDGSCYHDGHDRDEAQLICQQGGGSLAIVSSEEEYDFMVANFGDDTFYVGAQWNGNEWVWDDGTTIDPNILPLLNLPDGDADNSCLMMDAGVLTPTSCDIAMGFLCETPETPETPGVCEDDDDMYYDGSCYHTGSDRDEAQLICLQGGGSLAIVSSEEEYDFMVENFGAGTFYVGAKWDVNNNEWVWDDGSTLEPGVVALLDLPAGDATNSCLMMDDGVFTATSCDIAMGFLCETPTVCEDDMSFDGSCYHDGHDRDEAQLICQQGGGSLAIVSSQADYDFMVANFGDDTFYVGAQWNGNEWVWDDGTTIDPTILPLLNLPDGDADNSCLMMDAGVLTPTSCDIAMGFLCETPETPGVCEDDDDMYYDGSCYHTGSDRDEAQLICLQGGGSLAIVSSEEEYDFMVENFGAGTFYVGGQVG